MFKIIDFLLHGCWHHWKIYRESPVWNSEDRTLDKPMGYQYVLQCQKCGRVHHYNAW